ncbi:hypothetical protein [Flexithrix dorotheae]|nr:hypothetical protein [Flexithrix dorotheae]
MNFLRNKLNTIVKAAFVLILLSFLGLKSKAMTNDQLVETTAHHTEIVKK